MPVERGNSLSRWIGPIALAVWLCAGAASAARVHLEPEAHVTGPMVRLVDVGRIEGDLSDALSCIDLGPAPSPGQSKGIQAGLIRARIEQAGYGSDMVELTGAPAVRVTTAYAELTSAMLEQSLREFIDANMPWDPARTTVDLVTPSFTTLLPQGDVVTDWRPSPRYRYLGHGAFRGEVFVDGRSWKTLMCRAAIETYGDVLIAVRSIPRGEVVRESDLRVEEYAMSAAPNGALSDPVDAVGMVASRTVFPDTVLTSRHLARPVLVRRNQTVTVEVRSGSVCVRSQARALKDGSEGDLVPCADPGSKEEFVGLVRGDGVVVVD